MALHFNWVAIYDNRTIFSCNEFNEINMELPKREYSYLFRATFYENEYGTFERFLNC